MYSAVAPPSALNEGVTVHKLPEEVPKGRVTKANFDKVLQARAKNQVVSQQLAKEANKRPRVAGNKRKEPPKDDKKEENDKKSNIHDNPLEMMKHYFNPNPQLRGVPEGALAPKSELEEDIDKAIEAGDYAKADALNEQLAKHKHATQILTSIECVKYTIDQRREEQITRERKKPTLSWTFDPKRTWERKGNM